MAILSTLTDINNITRMMKLTATAGEGTVTILERDQATGALSSSYLSAYHLTLITDKINQVLSLVAPGDLPLMAYLLQSFVRLSDFTGIATPLGNVAAGVERLQLTGLIDNQAVYVIAAIPHSVSDFAVIAPL